jgi:hypothetical protein
LTIVILLVLVGLLWMAVLAPSGWRKFKERQGVGSIDHFHHQLQLLEHAGPKTVAPAYRLHTAVPASTSTSTSAGAADHGSAVTVDASRPKLVLLRPTDDAAAADVDDHEGFHYERVGVLDRPEPVCPPEMGADLRALRREEARRRFTVLLRCLIAVAVTTGFIGLFPGMHLAWVFTGLTGVAALALVGLMAYAKEVEAEQQRLVRGARQRPSVRWEEGSAGTDDGSFDPSFDPASAGYPGAWDEEFAELPQAAVR